jgi:hypothetical protein
MNDRATAKATATGMTYRDADGGLANEAPGT